jgi:hypothetical protein
LLLLMWKTFEPTYCGIMTKVWDARVADCCVAEDAVPVNVFAHYKTGLPPGAYAEERRLDRRK